VTKVCAIAARQRLPSAVILSAAKDLTKLVNDVEYCEVPRRLRGSG